MNKNTRIIDKCRLCLADGDKNDLTPLFIDNDDSELSLAAQIMICLSIPVQARDSLPRSVCKICENNVTQFYAFREICYYSYYSLLERRVSNDSNEFSQDDTNKSHHIESQNFKQNSKLECVEETRSRELCSEQKVHRSIQLSMNNQSVAEIPQEIHLEDSKVDVTIENLQSNSIEEETTSANVDFENTHCKSRQSNDKPEQKALSDEDVNNDEEVHDIGYKCMLCESIFPDLESASIHCAECSPREENDGNAMTDQVESVEDLKQEEESIEDRIKNVSAEAIEEESLKIPGEECRSRDRISQRKIILPYRNENSEILKSSSISRKRKINEKNLRHNCPNCESAFSSAALLRRHSVVHTGERPFECPICKKRFSQVGQLNFHKNFHDNPRYRCEICKKPFLRPSDIEKHMRTHTGEKPFDCRVCSKSFAQLVALQQHVRIHTGDKPYVCEICDKRFSQKANKTKHVKIHKGGAKPHTCEICGRSFSDIEEMNIHRAGHDGGKPRKCNYCDESFRKMSELAQHIRRYHTFERPHKCAFCQKAFYSLYNLKQHVMVHTGHKPYACSQCDFKFTQKGNLTKHYGRKHGNKCDMVVENEEEIEDNLLVLANNTTDTYACNQCNLKFNKKDKLQRHLNQHEDYRLDSDKYVVIKSDDCFDEDDEKVLILANGQSENTTNPMTIEREEIVPVETGEIHTNLQIYEIINE